MYLYIYEILWGIGAFVFLKLVYTMPITRQAAFAFFMS